MFSLSKSRIIASTATLLYCLLRQLLKHKPIEGIYAFNTSSAKHIFLKCPKFDNKRIVMLSIIRMVNFEEHLLISILIKQLLLDKGTNIFGAGFTKNW